MVKKGISLLLLLLPAVFFLRAQKQGVFTENQGQIADEYGNSRPDILFTARLDGAKAYITRRGIHYVFSKNAATYRLDMKWSGASIDGTIKKINPTEGLQNFYLPHCPQGVLGVKSYESVLLEDVYPNIDVLLYSKNGFFEYDFRVKPGGQVSDIRIKYEGANDQTLLENGNLEVATPFATLTENAPVAFQDSKKLWAAFVTDHSGFITGFAVSSEYDRTKLLVIDPLVKIWGTYYGGQGHDAATGLFTDAAGNVYMCGNTLSDNNIVLNGHQNTRSDTTDVFVAKFDKNGTRLWATYYGAARTETATKVFAGNGAAFYLCGNTYSDTLMGWNGFQNEKGGKGDSLDRDGFLVKFDSSGTRMWATYYGGYEDDRVYGGAADKTGNVYISGATHSPTGIGKNGFRDFYNDAGKPDAFLARFDASGNLQWGTYFGGLFSNDYGLVAVGKYGDVYLAGITESTTDVAHNAYKGTYAGNTDVYIARFDGGGARYWGTYFGGVFYDDVRDITTDADGNIYFTGMTESQAGIAANGYRNTLLGDNDIYLAKIDTAGATLWATYYGGDSADVVQSVFTDATGNVYISGSAASGSGIAYRMHGTKQGATDAFVAKFATGGLPEWATYIGGEADEDGYATAGPQGMVYVCGSTASTTGIDFKGHQSQPDGQTDGYLIKFSPNTGLLAPQPKNSFCAGDEFAVPYYVFTDIDSTNTFTLQLSDSTGSFDMPLPIAQKNNYTTGNDTLPLQVPPTLPDGVYRFRLLASAPVDTLLSGPFSIYHKPIAEIYITDTAQCLSSNVFVFADSSTGQPTQWRWQLGENTTDLTQHPVKTYMAAGNYTVSLEATTVNGCKDTTTANVTVFAMPTAGFNISKSQSCVKDNAFEFTDTSKGLVTQYRWEFGDTGIQSVATVQNPVKNYAAAGTYAAWQKVTDINNCKDSTAKLIRVYPQPATPVITGNATVLGRSTLDYEAQFTPGNLYSWLVNGGAILSGAGTNKISVLWDNGPAGEVKVYETSLFGCMSDTVGIGVNISPVSVGGLEATARFTVYPNPAANTVFLYSRGNDIVKLRACDALGRVVELPVENNTCDISALLQGIYTLEATFANGAVYRAKVVKQ